MRAALSWTLLAAGVALVACKAKEGPILESQVAARVNHGDITVHQVHSVLRIGAKSLAEQPEVAARRALGMLVEQELAAQAARSQGLDKDPQVLQRLEVARRDVLARAYQDRIAAQVTHAASDDIDRFYESHPELFSQRRIYTLQEYAIEAPVNRLAALVADLPGAQVAQRIEGRLDGAGVTYGSRIYAQAAEDMPLALLQKIYPLAPGKPLLVDQPVGTRLFIVLHAQPAPVSRQLAIPSIGGYLVTERQRREVQAQMKSLRDAATITLSPAFAASASASTQAATATLVR